MTNSDTRRTAEFAIGALVRHLRPGPDDRGWLNSIQQAAANSRRMPLKVWMLANDGRAVETLQATVNNHDEVVRSWEPHERTVDAHTRAGGVRFLDRRNRASHREYPGVIVVHATPRIWVGYDSSMSTVLVYRVVEEG